MFHSSDKPQEFYSNKEKPVRKILVELTQNTYYNALKDEPYCPLSLARVPEHTERMIVNCETDEEALRVAKYHYCLTGKDFKIIN